MPSLFDNHLKRKRFSQNFAHVLAGISLELAPFRGSNISQLFQRLLDLSTKRFGKSNQFGEQRKEKILSFLDLLLKPVFDEANLLKSKTNLFGDSSSSLDTKGKVISFLLNNIPSKVLYPSVSVQVIASYIRRQMSLPQKLKDLDFRINLKTGISMLALFIFKRLPLGSSIRGLRIVCSGR
jgi:hypothetical protein